MRFPFGETVVLHRFKENGRNPQGYPVKVFYPDETVEKVAVAPYRTVERPDGITERVIELPALYVPPGLNVKPEDEATVRGERYAVDGGVSGEWVNPFTGWAPGSEIRLKRVTG